MQLTRCPFPGGHQTTTHNQTKTLSLIACGKLELSMPIETSGIGLQKLVNAAESGEAAAWGGTSV
jgi:hypothetical protein